METFLRIGSKFDWISPTKFVIDCYRNRPVTHFIVQSADEQRIRERLKANGIRIVTQFYDDEFTAMTVRSAQADWTGYNLERINVWYRRRDAKIGGWF